MKMLALMKKEAMSQFRTGKVLIFALLFTAFGLMNPGIALLTPWLYSLFSDVLAASGMIVTETTVDASVAWAQFFKNIPMALIAFVLIESGIFTKEYQKGTLTLSLTKGLKRPQVIYSKALTLLLLWTAGYWLCYFITFGCCAWLWNNAVMYHLGFSAFCWWLYGAWAIGLMALFSVLAKSNIGVMGGAGGVCLIAYLIGLLPAVGKYSPAMLMKTALLMMGLDLPASFYPAMGVTLLLLAGCVIAAIPIFNKKQL